MARARSTRSAPAWRRRVSVSASGPGMRSGRPFGTAADFVCLPSAQAVPMPAGVDLELGAGFGVPAMTAYFSLFSDGRAGRPRRAGHGGRRGGRPLRGAVRPPCGSPPSRCQRERRRQARDPRGRPARRNQDIHGCRAKFLPAISMRARSVASNFKAGCPRLLSMGATLAVDPVRYSVLPRPERLVTMKRASALRSVASMRAIALCFRLQL
mgnify:CR=1 FL=1